MATNVPNKLRTADITRFATRGAQVEKYKPAVAYWTYYYMVQQILGKGLHNQDEECKTYTSALMDKLEEIKGQSPSDDAILDDMAGQAYVEQFGLETFQRADGTMGANKVSKQTADTFQAAATFLDLTHIWGQPAPEIISKVKYAKYHALRIAKALKAGEDPNLSNPPPIPAPEEAAMQLDPNDPEVQAFTGGSRQPTVEDIPDETQRRMSVSAGQSRFDQSLHPSRESSIPPKPGKESMWLSRNDDAPSASGPPPPMTIAGATPLPDRAISPLPPRSAHSNHDAPIPGMSPQPTTNGTTQQPPPNPRQDSLGGGYFPGIQLPGVPTSPAAPDPPISNPLSPVGYASPTDQAPLNPQDYYSAPQRARGVPPPVFSPPETHSYPPPLDVASPDLPQYHHQQQTQHHQAPHYQQAPYEPTPPPSQAPYMPPQQPPSPALQRAPPMATPSHVEADDEAVAKAAKHAKWAVSSLTFEDVPEAIKQLRLALHTLGAS